MNNIAIFFYFIIKLKKICVGLNGIDFFKTILLSTTQFYLIEYDDNKLSLVICLPSCLFYYWMYKGFNNTFFFITY